METRQKERHIRQSLSLLTLLLQRLSADGTTTGSDSQATITLRKPNLGDVIVTPDEVTAEDVVNLRIRYDATIDLAMPVSSTDADDATFGRVQIMLPAGWGPDSSE